MRPLAAVSRDGLPIAIKNAKDFFIALMMIRAGELARVRRINNAFRVARCRHAGHGLPPRRKKCRMPQTMTSKERAAGLIIFGGALGASRHSRAKRAPFLPLLLQKGRLISMPCATFQAIPTFMLLPAGQRLFGRRQSQRAAPRRDYRASRAQKYTISAINVMPITQKK